MVQNQQSFTFSGSAFRPDYVNITKAAKWVFIQQIWQNFALDNTWMYILSNNDQYLVNDVKGASKCRRFFKAKRF